MSAGHPEVKKTSNPEKPAKKRGWINRFRHSVESFTLPKAHFELQTRPLLDHLKMFLAGGTSVAWLHSSVLFPSLAIATGLTWATRKYLMPDEHHGSGSGH